MDTSWLLWATLSFCFTVATVIQANWGGMTIEVTYQNLSCSSLSNNFAKFFLPNCLVKTSWWWHWWWWWYLMIDWSIDWCLIDDDMTWWHQKHCRIRIQWHSGMQRVVSAGAKTIKKSWWAKKGHRLHFGASIGSAPGRDHSPNGPPLHITATFE